MSTVTSPEPGHLSNVASTLFDLMDRVEYRRVDLADQFDPVYRLRYEAYRREEFVPINSRRVSGDSFDTSPNAYCFGVYVDGRLVSSVRLHHVTSAMRDSPSRTIWPEILDPLLDSGRSYIDPSRFTADHEASLAYPSLPFLTLRIVAMASVHFNVDYCLASVRPEHAAFYRRVFGAKQFADTRYFGELTFPVCLYMAEVPLIRERVYDRYPFFTSTSEERQQMFGTGKVAAIRPSARQAQRLAQLAEEQVA